MDFNDNGTISLSVGGKTYTLRSATVGQWKELSDLAVSLRSEALEQLADWRTELETADDEQAAQIRSRMADSTFGLTAINEPWMRKAFELCGSDTLPDDLSAAPADMLSPDIITAVLEHWRSVPLARSRRA